jgi:hypothetical protein
VAKVAVTMRRSHFGPDHAEARIGELAYIRGFNRLGEARPAAPGLIFVGGCEQGLAGHDIDVDAGILVAQILARAGPFGAALLRHPIFFGGERGERLFGFAIFGHVDLHFPWVYGVGVGLIHPSTVECPPGQKYERGAGGRRVLDRA